MEAFPKSFAVDVMGSDTQYSTAIGEMSHAEASSFLVKFTTDEQHLSQACIRAQDTCIGVAVCSCPSETDGWRVCISFLIRARRVAGSRG